MLNDYADIALWQTAGNTDLICLCLITSTGSLVKIYLFGKHQTVLLTSYHSPMLMAFDIPYT